MTIKPYIIAEEARLVDLRRWFHAHPEASMQEHETARKIAAELDSFGVPYQLIGDTAIAATIKGTKPGEGKIVALRADMDALQMEDLKDTPYASKHPGYCHACGHDAHVAALLVAAKVLQEKRTEFSGEVRLFFQPGEEIGAGARLFLQAGLLEGVHRVFGVHVTSLLESGEVSLTPGPQNASCDYFEIEVTGRGTHVSTPELGVDALYIAAQIVNNLQSIVSRQTAAGDSVIVGVGTLNAGTQYNIVAEHARLEGTTRAFTPDSRAFTNNRVKTIAEETAKLHGGTARVDFKAFASPLINDAEVAEEVRAIAAPLVGEENIITNNQKALMADDFADFLAETKGLYALVGAHDPARPETGISHHHGLFDIDETALLTCCNLYVDVALAYV
ncbi:MAG: amidohydrolase [Oscillospiraceae bacterium]|nr:amidohydrolase [Oscillospiraceae bacterium]